MKHYRRRLARAALGALHAASHFRYEEIRPIPYEAFEDLMDGEGGIVITDCSGLVTCCFYRAGLPDPNGLKYNGQGFTGTLLGGTLPVKNRIQLRMGDPCVLGGGTGRHVVIAVEDGWNPMCVSHGKPGDPHIAPLDSFLGLGPLTVLNARPGVIHRIRHRRLKWIVVGDEDHTIGHAVGVVRWSIRHRRLRRHQHHQLHFNRIKKHPAGAGNPSVQTDL